MFADYFKHTGLALAVAAGLGLNGCANMPGQESSAPVAGVPRLVSTSYYPQCYQPVEELRRYDASARMAKRQEEARTLGILTGVAIGAVAGAVLDKGNRGRGAALGGLAGGIIGAMATAQQDDSSAQKAAQDRSKLTRKYADYIGGDVSDMDLTLAAAQKAQSCYQREFTKLIKDKKRGRISAQEGRPRMTEIVAGLQETNSLIATVDSRFTENIAVYSRSYEESLQQSGMDRQQVASSTTTRRTSSAKAKSTPAKSIPNEVKDTERKLQQAENKRSESKKVVQTGTSMVRDICKNPDAGDWAPTDKCTA